MGRTESFYTLKSLPDEEGTVQYAVRKDPNGDELRGSVLLPKIDKILDFEGLLTTADFEAEEINLDDHKFMRVRTGIGDFTYDLTNRELGFIYSLRPDNPLTLIEAVSIFASTSGTELPVQAVSGLLQRVISSVGNPKN